jgi:hypothetical protein
MDASPQSQQVAPAPQSPEPVRDDRDGISQIPPKIQIPAESKKPKPPLGKEKATQSVILKEVEATPKIIKETTDHPPNRPAMTPMTPPSLNLSAIAWSEEPSKRIAMINDTMIREGSEILGVKVVEIFPHRVRLSYNGQPFEISLSH